MAKYIIKNNLPAYAKAIHLETDGSLYTAEARSAFLRYANYLANFYNFKIVFRNKRGQPMRGTIQVEIDGFYYYVELYKEK